MEKRAYYIDSKQTPLAIGDNWYVHTYCLPDVDDNYIPSEYLGTNSHGDHVFKPNKEAIIAYVDFQKFDDNELNNMIFKIKN